MPVLYSIGSSIDQKKPSGKFDWIFRGLPIPNWSVLSVIGASRSFRFLLWWVVLIPIFARLASGLPEKVVLPIPGQTPVVDTIINPNGANTVASDQKLIGDVSLQPRLKPTEFQLSLSLPFSWKLLYFAGLGVLIGNAIFAWKCPKVVNLDAYRSANLSAVHIGELMAEVLQPVKTWTSNRAYFDHLHVCDQLHHDYEADAGNVYSPPDKDDLSNPTAAAERLALIAWDEKKRVELLAFVQVIARWQGFYFRLAATACYSLAFVAMVWIAYQNVVYVVSVPSADTTKTQHIGEAKVQRQ
jgi:hypothetical protein